VVEHVVSPVIGNPFCQKPDITIIPVLHHPPRRRVTETLSSTPRCAPLVRRGARTQRPSFQTGLLLSDHFGHPLGPIVRAPSLDTDPPLTSPLLCHLTSHLRGQCAVGQSVPRAATIPTLFREPRSVFRPRPMCGLGQCRVGQRPMMELRKSRHMQRTHSRSLYLQ
jgi:hypothetical protein